MVSIRRMTLIFSSTCFLDILLHFKNLFEGHKLLQNFSGDFKIQKSLSKVEKCQNILRITKLENVEKMH